METSFAKTKVHTLRLAQAILLSFALFFSFGAFASAGDSDAKDFKTDRLHKIEDKSRQLKLMRPDKLMWLRGPVLQKVFNDVSSNMDLVQHLTPRQRELLKKDSEAIEKELEKKTASESTDGRTGAQSPTVTAQLTQTYVLMYALAIIEIIKNDATKSYISRTSHFDETGTKVLQAIAEIVDSGEIISALVGAGVTHKVLERPLMLIQYLASDSKMAPLFRNFMIHFTATLVSFTGWEFGTQLWKEASNMLDFQLTDESERLVLKDRSRLLTLLFRSLTPQSLAKNPKQYQASRKILALIWNNIVKIIALDGDLRLQWLYNSLRLRIANGNFATLVSTMVTSSAVGTTLFPGAGTALGMAFGLFGGTFSLFVPEENKNQITTALKNGWMELLDSTEGAKSSAYLKFGFDQDGRSKLSTAVRLDDVLVNRTRYRELLGDVYIERIYYSNGILQANNETLANYFELSKSQPSNKKLQDEISKLYATNLERFAVILDSMKSLVSLYLTEAQRFEALKSKHPTTLHEKLDAQVINAENMYTHFCSFSESFLSLDYLNLRARFSNAHSSLEKIKSMCKLEIGKSVPYYQTLSGEKKKSYDSAVRFLEKTYWTKFDEQAVSLGRLDDLFSLAE